MQQPGFPAQMMSAVKLQEPAYFQVSMYSPTVNHPIQMKVPEAWVPVRMKAQGVRSQVLMKGLILQKVRSQELMKDPILQKVRSVRELLPVPDHSVPVRITMKGQEAHFPVRALRKCPVYKGSV